METSLRYGGDSKSLRLHAKQKLQVTDNSVFQFSGELDTRIGAPTHLHTMIKYFYPDLSASFGVGVQYDRQLRNDKVLYNIRGKKAFPVTSDGLVSFNVKGRCYIDEYGREIKYSGAAEFVYNIFNFSKDQDLRLKFGYNAPDKIPYMKIQENNWTLSADGNRRWNVRYDL